MVEYLVGNLTADPELRYTSSGKAVASLRVAVNERHQNAEGKWVNGEAKFYDVAVWDDQAERAANQMCKGDRVLAVGYTKIRSWTDKEGNEHSAQEFVAQDIGHSLKFELKR